MYIIGCVYWKLVYVAVNVGSVPYKVCVVGIGVCAVNVGSVLYGVCVL